TILSPGSQNAPDAATRKFLRDNGSFLGNEVAAQVFQAAATPREELAKQMENSLGNSNSSNRMAGKLKSAEADSLSQFQSDYAALDKKATLNTSPATAGAPWGSAAGSAQLNKDGAKGSGDVRSRDQYKMSLENKSDALNSKPAGVVTGGMTRFDLDSSNKEAATEPLPAPAAAPVSQAKDEKLYRKVAPQKLQQNNMEQPVSQLNVETSRFSQLVADEREGVLARFVQDELQILFWVRPDRDKQLVFGAQVDPKDLNDLLEPILAAQSQAFTTSRSFAPGTCVAILDDRAKLVTKSLKNFTANWKTPFVATEIGEALPHWEVALYLTDPDQLSHSARLVSVMLVSLIALALGAIAWGGYLVVTDTRRQLDLVRKKTDFVSNVSHELKTPLTSIRMFAELLHEKRVTDPDKVSGYLKIITLESERLTRLINNVLDFARMERNQKRYNKRPIDLHAVIQKIWEGQEMHLHGLGFETVWHTAQPPYCVFGDEDALAQVIVNLLSNAEKYSGPTKSIELHTYIVDGQVCVGVLDRGPGVPRGEETKIFEHFYRAHDSLSSGIQGSGLGLTLAQKIATDHGGTIIYEPRKDGGSSFTLKIPEHREPA
ncbi:MAG: HAMP domain-containing sensor histidine kinase, partial [Verrucomicrobiota bacterium]